MTLTLLPNLDILRHLKVPEVLSLAPKPLHLLFSSPREVSLVFLVANLRPTLRLHTQVWDEGWCLCTAQHTPAFTLPLLLLPVSAPQILNLSFFLSPVMFLPQNWIRHPSQVLNLYPPFPHIVAFVVVYCSCLFNCLSFLLNGKFLEGRDLVFTVLTTVLDVYKAVYGYHVNGYMVTYPKNQRKFDLGGTP